MTRSVPTAGQRVASPPRPISSPARSWSPAGPTPGPQIPPEVGMPELSLAGVVVVAAVAFAVPLLLGLFPRLRLPSVVLEIVVGIVLGPSVLGWVRVDLPLQVLSLLGLAFLLFLAGLEIDVDKLRGKLLGLVAVGFAVSFVIALAVSAGMGVLGLV